MPIHGSSPQKTVSGSLPPNLDHESAPPICTITAAADASCAKASRQKRIFQLLNAQRYTALSLSFLYLRTEVIGDYT
jgi:hypothetical protein